jgi:molybdopterin-guanine dinucleotide biosynthesis protein B
MGMRILQVVGYKNAGKTTLIGELVRQLAARGLRVGTLKHDAHNFEPDIPGTDTWQHRQAGAVVTAITSPSRTAWVQERATPLEELVSDMANNHSLDVLVIEGFKAAPYPKVVLIRSEQDGELLTLPGILAVALREPNKQIQVMAEAMGLSVFTQPNIQSLTQLILHLFVHERDLEIE